MSHDDEAPTNRTASGDFYDDFWRREDETNRTNPASKHRIHLVLQELKRLEKPPSLLLDIGCGNGELLRRVNQVFPQTRLWGMDVSKQAAQLATDVVQRVYVHDLTVAPLQASVRFDVVVMTELLEHLKQPVALLKNLRASLSEHAHVIITTPTGPMTPYDRAIGHVKHLTLSELEVCCSQAGYETVRAYRWGFPFHSLYRIIVGLLGENVSSLMPTERSRLGHLTLSAITAIFYCNMKSRSLGRQIVAVIAPSGGAGEHRVGPTGRSRVHSSTSPDQSPSTFKP